MTNFGKNLKGLIEKLAISQASIENVVEKRQTTISNWIHGRTDPNAEDLVRLSLYFGISVDDLLFTDLEGGNLITEAFVQKFKQKGSLNGNVTGNLTTKVHQFIGEQAELKKDLSQSEETAFWTLLQMIRQLDSKLDLLRASVEAMRKEKG